MGYLTQYRHPVGVPPLQVMAATGVCFWALARLPAGGPAGAGAGG